MGKIFLTLIVFSVLPVLLFTTIFLFTLSYFHAKPQPTKQISQKSHTDKTIASLSTATRIEENEMEILVDRYISDSRIEGVRNFFAYYKSPLEPYAEDVVILADVYGIDYRLVPAIAMQESTLCKRIPAGTNNCWGFGIYGKKKTGFESYLHGIHIVTKALATRYVSQGLTTPSEIMSKYTPSNKGDWARNVNDFMARIEQMTPQPQNSSPVAENNRKPDADRGSLGFAL